MDEKITLIIPAFNIVQYISSCLSSVINQTWTNLEIIVVDDGSTDNTVTVLQAFAEKDKRVKIVQKENGGVTSARLAGVRQATGDYIGFVDGDDIIEPDMYERLVRNARKYHADISHCGYQMVFPSRVVYYYNTGRIVQQNKETGLKDLLSGSFVEPGLCNKLFRKNLFEKMMKEGLMDTIIKNNEDLLMNFYLFRESKCAVYEDWCPYHYLVRKGSATSSRINEHKLLDPIKVTEILMQETEGNIELQSVLLQRYIRQLINLGTMPVKENSKLILPHKKQARKLLRNHLIECLKDNNVEFMVKVMALWSTIWPWSYEKIHQFYVVITGKSKKYALD